jgi:type I restriction enzyme S subunit
MKWQNLHFSKIVRDVTGGQKKIQKKAYLPQGQIPVVDQGQQLFSGYTNDETALFNKNIPVIIFGDHTRIVKYIDFPFAIGADGVKVLEAHGSLSPKFFYYYCQSIEIPSRGYSRHFKFLRNIKIPLPPPSEQHRIVEILDKAEQLRKLRTNADAKAQCILPALFIKMFGDPATNPMGWTVGTLGDVCERITDGTHQPPPFVENGIPFLFVQNIVKGVINFNTQKFITEETYRSLTRTITPQKDDILYSTVGSYGVAVVVDTNRLFLFQRHMGHLRPKGALMDSWFLCAQMNTPYVKAQADQRARGLAQKTLNLSEIRQFQVIIPPLVEQKKFKLAMQNFKKITGRVNDQEILIESLFKIILHRAFTGDLTASWRKAHMKELLQEMELQAKALAS